MIVLKYIETPLGTMRMGATDKGICLFDFVDRQRMDTIMDRVVAMRGGPYMEGEHPLFEVLETEIGEYFAGTRKTFDVPVDMVGSPFQVRVWEALLEVPYGETRTYKQQTERLGDEKAIRAVANANGSNGIAILVPCHRIIGTNGSLTGYGGGIQRKQALLMLERQHSPAVQVQGTLFG